MTLEIFLTLAIIAVTLVAFIREWGAPDVIALSVLCLVIALGLVDKETVLAKVFGNHAPITIAALFIIGGALEKSGAVDQIGRMLRDRLSGNLRSAIFAFAAITAFFSAWMNNTAIVAIMLPVTLGFARSKNIAASRLLMPLSYASILGGCSTLIGTSTNIIANGKLADMGAKQMTMFELAPVGIPLCIIGIIYLAVFGPRLIPARSSVSGVLEMGSRMTPLYHILIGQNSSLIGQKLSETPLADRELGVHVMEIRRKGTRLMLPLSQVVIEKNDRFMIAIHSRKNKAAQAETFFESIGAQLLSTVDGIVSELVVRDESSLLGKTLARADFRQKYNCIVLALHRKGVNVTDRLAALPLEDGDTLLVITALNNLDALEATRDFVLTDSPDDLPEEIHPKAQHPHIKLSWVVLIGVVLVATLTDVLHNSVGIKWIPEIEIHYAAAVGALVLLWMKVITPREAYASVDWQVLLMLYGLLGLGLAMEHTGTARWLADGMVGGFERFIPKEHLPLVLLWLVFALTVCITEVLSNNATVAMLIPIALNLGTKLEVDSRPFIIAVTIAASTAFALPMGYQTHMMVYGPGGYRFSDFLKVGIPLNIICWVVSCLIIPLVWPF